MSGGEVLGLFAGVDPAAIHVEPRGDLRVVMLTVVGGVQDDCAVLLTPHAATTLADQLQAAAKVARAGAL